MTPTKKLSMSVTEVMVIDTAASLKVSLILSGTGACNDVRRHAPSITKVSSMPMPNMRKGAARLMPIKGIPQYIIVPKAAIVAKTADITPNKPKIKVIYNVLLLTIRVLVIVDSTGSFEPIMEV